MAIDYSETTEDTQVFKEPHQAYAATILNFNPTNPNETPIDPSPITSHPMPSTSAGIHHHPHSKNLERNCRFYHSNLNLENGNAAGETSLLTHFPLLHALLNFKI